MNRAIDIAPEQRAALAAIFSRFLPGVAVWAYGSRVNGSAQPNSDLDLVVFSSPEQRAALGELQEEIAESSAIPYIVDLHVWNQLPESFQKNIQQEHEVLIEG